MAKEEDFKFRCTADFKRRAQAAASADGRTLTGFVIKAVEEKIERVGSAPRKTPPDPRRKLNPAKAEGRLATGPAAGKVLSGSSAPKTIREPGGGKS